MTPKYIAELPVVSEVEVFSETPFGESVSLTSYLLVG